jgi:hypothetical protein
MINKKEAVTELKNVMNVFSSLSCECTFAMNGILSMIPQVLTEEITDAAMLYRIIEVYGKKAKIVLSWFDGALDRVEKIKSEQTNPQEKTNIENQPSL